MSVSLAISTIKDPGRLYRPMFCPDCEGVRLHRVDFIAAERYEKGRFVWFTRRCTGIAAIDHAHPDRLMRLTRSCGREEDVSLPVKSWKHLTENCYY